VENAARKGESPVYEYKGRFLSKAINVYFCLKRAEPFAKPKYILSNR